MKELISEIEQWGIDKGIVAPGNVFMQLAKLDEELFKEFVFNTQVLRTMVKEENDKEYLNHFIETRLMDDIGDVQIVLILLAKMLNVDIKSNYEELITGDRCRLEDLFIGQFSSYSEYFVQNLTYLKGDLSDNICKQGSMLKTQVHYNIASILHIVSLYTKEFLKIETKDCLRKAFKEIKSREGISVNGNFVKNSDMPKQE